MISLVFNIAVNIIVGAILLLWGFVLSTHEYNPKKHEKKYFIAFVVATVIGNVVYWLY